MDVVRCRKYAREKPKMRKDYSGSDMSVETEDCDVSFTVVWSQQALAIEIALH